MKHILFLNRTILKNIYIYIYIYIYVCKVLKIKRVLIFRSLTKKVMELYVKLEMMNI